MTLNLKVMPSECGDEIWRQKTRIMELPYGEEIRIVMGTVQSMSVTDRQTDRFTMTKTALCIASRGKNGSAETPLILRLYVTLA